MSITRKRKKCYAELEPVKKKTRVWIHCIANITMKSKTFSVVVQKNINPYLHLQKIICWAKEEGLPRNGKHKKKILARKRTERSNARQLNAIMHNDLNSCRAYFLKK